MGRHADEGVRRRRKSWRKKDREIRLPPSPWPHRDLRFGSENEAPASTHPATKSRPQPHHDELVQDGGRLLLLENAVDQLALDVVVERSPFIERDQSGALGGRTRSSHEPNLLRADGNDYRRTAASSSAGDALSPNVSLTCTKRSTFPGPKTKLPPSWSGSLPSLC